MLTYSKKLASRAFLSGLVCLAACFCCTPSLMAASRQNNQNSTQTIQPETTAGLQTFFQALDYDWMHLENSVPPFILETIPADINNSVGTAAKKRTFFMGLLPMILMSNQEIARERAETLQILEKHSEHKLKIDDRERLAEISKRYGLRGNPLVDHRKRSRLLRRVDTIPPSLVLAQAANESAWGTSRFAQEGNNLFGEWTFKPGSGIVPKGRPPGEIYEVRKFASLYESIRSYMNNLNRHGAYRELREIRYELRKSGQPVSGKALAKGLLKYSQRGEDYIREIQLMIQQNKLSRANLASLRQPQTEKLTSISTSGSGLFSTRNKTIGHTKTD